MPEPGLRSRLIAEGIAELSERGLQNFSVRRVAAKCGVSCAAPYKHFTDKQSFIEAIIDYINSVWDEKQRRAASRNQTLREKIVEICREYIVFLVENPQLRTIIMQSDGIGGKETGALHGRLSSQTNELVISFCQEAFMPDEMRIRKTYVVRSLIYGAALMMGNGDLPYKNESLNMAASMINREFDLP